MIKKLLSNKIKHPFLICVLSLLFSWQANAHVTEIRVNQNANGSLTWYLQTYQFVAKKRLHFRTERGNARCSITNPLDVLVFPNPSDGVFEIKLSNSNVASQILLFDLSGKLIERRTVTAEQATKSIVMDKSFLASGIYLLKIITKDETVTKKLIIRRE